jgi:hypothetical protein
MLKTVGFPSTRTGDQTILNGNLVIGTAGRGIDFSINPNPAGATSELLNDYEEGTWTPVIIGTTSAGTGTYTTQVGRYTKIGNRVMFNLFLDWSAHTGTGNMRISGLPFTSNATSGNLSAVSIVPSGVALTANNIMYGLVPTANVQVILYQALVGGGTINTVPLDTVASLYVSGHYEV